MYSCCGELQPAKNEIKETEENASKSPARSLDTFVSNLLTKQDPGLPWFHQFVKSTFHFCLYLKWSYLTEAIDMYYLNRKKNFKLWRLNRATLIKKNSANVQNYPAWSLDNAIFIWNAKEDPGLAFFSLFEKQTRLENCLFLFHLCTAVVSSCSQQRMK